MKPTEREIADFARQEANRSVFKSNFPHHQPSVEFGAKQGAQWAISQMQPEWVPINSVSDLPTKEGQFYVYQKTSWYPFYQINTFSGRLSNAVNDVTGKPIFSHYMNVVLPQPPKDIKS